MKIHQFPRLFHYILYVFYFFFFIEECKLFTAYGLKVLQKELLISYVFE